MFLILISLAKHLQTKYKHTTKKLSSVIKLFFPRDESLREGWLVKCKSVSVINHINVLYMIYEDKIYMIISIASEKKL